MINEAASVLRVVSDYGHIHGEPFGVVQGLDEAPQPLTVLVFHLWQICQILINVDRPRHTKYLQ